MELQTQRIPVHFCIQTSRVVHKLFWLQWATLEEVRRKLLSRELTVNDVQPDGYSVLHVSASTFEYAVDIHALARL